MRPKPKNKTNYLEVLFIVLGIVFCYLATQTPYFAAVGLLVLYLIALKSSRRI